MSSTQAQKQLANAEATGAPNEIVNHLRNVVDAESEMSSTIFVPVYQGRGLWAVKEIERSTGHSLGIVLDDIETQGSAEDWAKEMNAAEVLEL